MADTEVSRLELIDGDMVGTEATISGTGVEVLMWCVGWRSR